MNNKKIIMTMIMIMLLIVIVGAYALYGKLGDSIQAEQLGVIDNQESVGEAKSDKIKAPDFIVYDKQKNEVKFNDFIGKPIVLNFWASWCGPCQMEMNDFNEKYLEIGENIHFLMINMTDGSRETMEKASTFIQKEGYYLPIFFDIEMLAANSYRVYSLPTTYFIDKDGYIIAQATGKIDSETLQKGIDMILK